MKLASVLLIALLAACACQSQNPPPEAASQPASQPAGAKPPKFSVQIPNGDGPVMLSVESFDPDEVQLYSELLRYLDDQGRRVVVRINTNGGRIDGFMNLSQAMEDLRQPVICIADWHAYSAGVFLLESPGCAVRLMTKRTTLFFHEVLDGDISGNAHELRREADKLEVLTEAIIAFTSERLQMTEEAFKAKITDKEWILAYHEAQRVHAVDGIADPAKFPKLIRIVKNQQPQN